MGTSKQFFARGLRVIKVTKKRIYRVSRKGQINMYRVPGLYFGVDITGTDKKQISLPKFDSVIISQNIQ